MYFAKLQTTNFEFLTFSYTETDCREMMKRAWMHHQKETGATYSWNFVSEDVVVNFVRVGDTFRNGELIHGGNSAPSDVWVIGDDYSGIYFVVCEKCAKDSEMPVNYCDFYGETEETNCHNCKAQLTN